MRSVLLGLIRFYQFVLSPWVGSQCRFYPTCSEYAKAAIEKHGAGRGGWMAAKRLLKCNPWHAGGSDPVP